MYLCVCVCECVCVRACACMCVCVCVCTHFLCKTKGCVFVLLQVQFLGCVFNACAQRNYVKITCVKKKGKK